MSLPLDREDVPVIAAAVVTISTAIAAVRIDHNLATVATAIGAVVTALIGYDKTRRVQQNNLDVAHVGADATLDANARTVLVQTVTSERAVWRREMRAAAAELATILREADPKPHRDWRRVDQLTSEIRLRLNPNGRGAANADGKHALDHAVHLALDSIRQLDRRTAEGQAGLGGHDAKYGNALEDGHAAKVGPANEGDTLENSVADLLKQEWTKSKREAVTGELEDSEEVEHAAEADRAA